MDLRTYLANRRDVRPQDVERILEIANDLHNDARARRGLPPVALGSEDAQEPRFMEEAIWQVTHERADGAQEARVSARDRLLDERIAVEMRRMEARKETSGVSNVALFASGAIAFALLAALVAAGAVRGARSGVAEAIASRDAARIERDTLVRRAINLGRSAEDEGAAVGPLVASADGADGGDRVEQARKLLAAIPAAVDALPAEESRITARRFLRAEALSTSSALEGTLHDVAIRQQEVDLLYWRPLAGPHLWLGAVEDAADVVQSAP